MAGLTELLMDALFAAAGVALFVNLLVCLVAAILWRDDTQPEPPRVPEPPPRPSWTVLRPQTAAVRPRVVHPQSGEVFPLEEELRPLIAAGGCGAIRVVGGPGMGKTTAIKHLMAVLPDDANVRLMDQPDPRIIPSFARKLLVIYTSESQDLDDAKQFRLAPWDRDDLIEYLLAEHAETCGSVMNRLGCTTPVAYRGCPEIWRAILDTLAADAAIPNARTALSNYLQWLEPDLQKFKARGRACLSQMTCSSSEENPDLSTAETPFDRLLRHREVQILIAAEQLAEDLQRPQLPNEDYLARFFPKALIKEAAAILADDPEAISHLLRLLEQPLKHYSLPLSLLHAVGINWPPEFRRDPVLAFAYLEGIQWPGVDLAAAVLDHADFRKANLSQATLDVAFGRNANLRGANLSEATMIGCEFPAADLSHANLTKVYAGQSCFEHGQFEGANFQEAELSECVFTNADLKTAHLENVNLTGAFLTNANLEGACLRGANLSQAKLLDAKLDEADFTGANLESARLKSLRLRGACFDGVSFRNADMECCDLEGLRCRDVNFENANLKLAVLTDSIMSNANFTNACLRGAKLAEICWEGANLQGADLEGATFHMGSTRSGLLFTGIASEGTRTGFYTDEFEEQSFRAPEDIRKACLRGADLRGASLSGVDFYLVDLRGALYDADQAQHFRRCGAIL